MMIPICVLLLQGSCKEAEDIKGGGVEGPRGCLRRFEDARLSLKEGHASAQSFADQMEYYTCLIAGYEFSRVHNTLSFLTTCERLELS